MSTAMNNAETLSTLDSLFVCLVRTHEWYSFQPATLFSFLSSLLIAKNIYLSIFTMNSFEQRRCVRTYNLAAQFKIWTLISIL